MPRAHVRTSARRAYALARVLNDARLHRQARTGS